MFASERKTNRFWEWTVMQLSFFWFFRFQNNLSFQECFYGLRKECRCLPDTFENIHLENAGKYLFNFITRRIRLFC